MYTLFNTNLAKSVLYLAPKQLHGPPGGDGHPRESQGNVSTSKLMVAFIGHFICFICGKILEQGVKVTKIRQHLDYAPTSVRKPIIPILTASNLLQTYEWFVRNLVHCLGNPPGPCFFWSPKCLRCTQLPRKKQLCQRNLWFNGFHERFFRNLRFFSETWLV